MIIFWLNYYAYPHVCPFSIDFVSNNGFVKLSKISWFQGYQNLYDVDIGAELLNKGYKI